MSLNAYLWGMKVSAVMAFFAWAAIVLYIDPDKAGWFGNMLFYVTLFLWSAGAVMLSSVWLLRKMRGDEGVVAVLGMSLRQSILLAAYALVLLVFQYLRVLTWWDALLAAAGVLLVELYFLHQTSRPQGETRRLKGRSDA
jgi:hypothetical protein